MLMTMKVRRRVMIIQRITDGKILHVAATEEEAAEYLQNPANAEVGMRIERWNVEFEVNV